MSWDYMLKFERLVVKLFLKLNFYRENNHFRLIIISEK